MAVYTCPYYYASSGNFADTLLNFSIPEQTKKYLSVSGRSSALSINTEYWSRGLGNLRSLMTGQELFWWSRGNKYSAGGSLRENRNLCSRNRTKTILKGNPPQNHKSTRVKKTGNESMQKMGARYPRQGKLRRDPTDNPRNPLKAHAGYSCCFEAPGVYGEVKLCLGICWTFGAQAQLWAEQMAPKTGWLSDILPQFLQARQGVVRPTTREEKSLFWGATSQEKPTISRLTLKREQTSKDRQMLSKVSNVQGRKATHR